MAKDKKMNEEESNTKEAEGNNSCGNLKPPFGNWQCNPWNKPWPHHRKGGHVGRFIFMTTLLYILHLKGFLGGIPWWALALLIIGFTFMRL
jgi:hypothetical protein